MILFESWTSTVTAQIEEQKTYSRNRDRRAGAGAGGQEQGQEGSSRDRRAEAAASACNSSQPDRIAITRMRYENLCGSLISLLDYVTDMDTDFSSTIISVLNLLLSRHLENACDCKVYHRLSIQLRHFLLMP